MDRRAFSLALMARSSATAALISSLVAFSDFSLLIASPCAVTRSKIAWAAADTGSPVDDTPGAADVIKVEVHVSIKEQCQSLREGGGGQVEQPIKSP